MGIRITLQLEGDLATPVDLIKKIADITGTGLNDAHRIMFCFAQGKPIYITYDDHLKIQEVIAENKRLFYYGNRSNKVD